MDGINAINIQLTNILKVSDVSKRIVREIRNEDQVRKWMYTDHIITELEHKQWLKRLENDEKNKVFVVTIDDGKPLGVISINAIDKLHERAEWAYYLTGSARSGIGAVLEFHIINYVFNILNLHKLNCEVIENNNSVVSLHLKFGFKEEGFKRNNINKDGSRLGVHLLGITKEDWAETKTNLEIKFDKIFSKYAVSWE